MPELPEVETIRRYLEPVLSGQNIIRVIVNRHQCIQQPSVLQFQSQIRNQKIQAIHRKGKYLIFELTNYYLISHLRMEGKYFLVQPEDQLLNSDHVLVVFALSNKVNLLYHDTRRFGTFSLIPKKNNVQQLLPQVGYEPFDHRITPSYLGSVWQRKKIPVKAALLEQRFITGIGNIYASEILFASQISPFTPVNQLTDFQRQSIIHHTRLILTQAINCGGTTIFSFQSQPGVDGRFTIYLQVYGRSGQPCNYCQTLIIKSKIQNRGTYFCPKCQPETKR